MTHRIFAGVTALLIGAASAIAANPTLLDRVGALTEQAKAVAFEQLVPDTLLVDMLKGIAKTPAFAGSSGARVAVYHHYLRPVIEGDDNAFYETLYASFSIRSVYASRATEEETDALSTWRETVLEAGKRYLSDSARLKSFYQAKKELALATIRAMSPEDQENFRKRLTSFANGARAYTSSIIGIRAFVEDARLAEDTWFEDTDHTTELHRQLYLSYEEARQKLNEAAALLQTETRDVQWIARRVDDGGNELAMVWRWIADDMRNELKKT